MADSKRTSEDIETLIRNSTQRQWLTAQRVMDMSRAELQADEGAMSILIAVLIGGGGFDHWLNAPLADLEAHLNFAEDDADAGQAA